MYIESYTMLHFCPYHERLEANTAYMRTDSQIKFCPNIMGSIHNIKTPDDQTIEISIYTSFSIHILRSTSQSHFLFMRLTSTLQYNENIVVLRDARSKFELYSYQRIYCEYYYLILQNISLLTSFYSIIELHGALSLQ